MPVILYARRQARGFHLPSHRAVRRGNAGRDACRASPQMLDEFYDRARAAGGSPPRRGRELTHAVTVRARPHGAQGSRMLESTTTPRRRSATIFRAARRPHHRKPLPHEERRGTSDVRKTTTTRTAARPSTSRSTRCSRRSRTPRKTTSSYNKAQDRRDSTCASRSKRRNSERAYLESVLRRAFAGGDRGRSSTRSAANCRRPNYIRRSRSGKEGAQDAPSPRATFKTSSGLEILVGRSNVQNDQLTKKADKRDYWFHTQHIHGSHVILRCAGLHAERR